MYDSPNANVRREQSFQSTAGNAAVSCRMVNYQKTKLVAAHITVVTAGTSAGHSATIKNGTTSIGAVTLTTNTAGYQTSLDLADTEIASLNEVTCTNGTDATGVFHVAYEYDVFHDTTQSS